MPRKSRAEWELEPYVQPAQAVSLPPPAGLSEAARSVWVDLVASHDEGHFTEGDVTLMQQYCEAASLAQKAAVALQAGDDTRLKVWERATSIMASLALRLRLGPQSRRERQASASKPRSWMDDFAAAQERLRKQSRRQDGGPVGGMTRDRRSTRAGYRQAVRAMHADRG
jgi:phage terminase small subunit